MIAEHANILSAPYLKPSSTFLLQDVNGECCPHDMPPWQDVYSFFRKWREEGHIEHLLQKLIRKIRRKRGQHESPSVGALDSQSVKWCNRKSINGYDGNKKVKGIKRHIVVDRNGFPLARVVTHAGIHDTKVVEELCEQTRFGWEILKKLLVDRGYRGDITAAIKKDFFYRYRSIQHS